MSWKASAWAKDQRLGSPSAKSMLMCLADYADPEGLIKGWASQSDLAEAAEVSERTVREWLQRLEDWGLIRRQRQHGEKGVREADWIVLDLAANISDGAERCRNLKRETGGESGAGSGAESGGESGGESSLPANSAGRAYRQPDAEPTGNQTQSLPATSSGRSLYIPPIDPPITALEREGARAVGQEGQDQNADGDAADDTSGAADDPQTAAFRKRVQRLCSGRGFVAGAWADWDTTSLRWIAKQFAALSLADREAAERWRDAYLLDIADRGKKPMPIGVFLRDRAWDGLDPAIMRRLEARKAASARPEEQAKPDGWAAMAGPVGMAKLFADLLAGPSDEAAAARLRERPLLSDPALRAAWERVWQWRALRSQKGGAVFGERWHGLKAAMEPIPVTSAVLAAWREAFAARGWPWLPDFERGEVFYAPKGGPAGLGEFEAAIRGGSDAERAESYDQAC